MAFTLERETCNFYPLIVHYRLGKTKQNQTNKLKTPNGIGGSYQTSFKQLRLNLVFTKDS